MAIISSHGSRIIHIRPLRRPMLCVVLLAVALVWQVTTSGALLAADSIALSEPWQFVDESKPGAPSAIGDLAITGTDSPTQVAARFNISSTMQALALHLYDGDLASVRLADLEELSYCTRLLDSPRPYAVTLQLNIDADIIDDDHAWQGRLVFTPAHNGAVIQGEWQCWNTLVGKWWATGGPLADYATEENPMPLGTLLAHFPNLGIHEPYSAVALKAGDGWSYFQGEASPVVIRTTEERIEVAFGAAPQDSQPNQPLNNEVLLPVVFNEPQDEPRGNSEKDNGEKDKEKNKDKADKDKKQKPRGNGAEWESFTWFGFDWDSIEWEKVDWEHLDWAAFGWSNKRTEKLRAFIKDVKLCDHDGWREQGFDRAGACVRHYIELHTPSDLDWNDLDWKDFNWYAFSWDRVGGDNGDWDYRGWSDRKWNEGDGRKRR